MEAETARKKVLVITGPTATGKTALGVELALRLDGEVISADSMQIYRGMDIGTAKPTAEERRAVPHHLLDLREATEPFSAADYAAAAKAAIADIAGRGALPILCGGTGLYLDSLLRPPASPEAENAEEVRASLYAEAERDGREALYARLSRIDPEAAAKIHPNNLRRVVRALEIYDVSGITKTEWDRRSKEYDAPYRPLVFSLTWQDRALLAARIEQRVDEMLAAGLYEEARALYERGALSPETTAGQAIGYKEFLDCFDGRADAASVRERIVIATRQYAKRQETWFRAHRDFIRLIADEGGAPRTTDALADACMPAILEHLRKETN